jgi:hypothetical protein
VPQNGEINENFGTYKSICCGAEIVIKAGTPFPECRRHLKLPTIWKLILAEKTVAQDRNKSDAELHIENHRLFNLAGGAQRFEAWEREHLHGCNLCQGVLYLFIRQPIRKATDNPEEAEDAVPPSVA